MRAWFAEHFPDALALIPNLEQQWREHPVGALVGVSLEPWNLGDRAVVMGDAAHAMTPFYGQGMNCGFEDALYLDEVLDECGGDLARAVPAFAAQRKPMADAIGALSLRNYTEMSHHTASGAFLLRKRIEGALHALFPRTWVPQYTMVAFTRIPYDEALARADRQDVLIGRAATALTIAGLGAAVYAAARVARAYGYDVKALRELAGKRV